MGVSHQGSAHGGGLSAQRISAWGCLPGVCGSRHPPPQQMATAADGTHPTGMHSCCVCRHAECLQMHAVSAPRDLLIDFP